MANEQDKDQFETEGQKETGQQGQPQPTSEQSQKSETGQQGGQASTGQAGSESSGGTDTLTDQQADIKNTTDGSGSQSGGFVGSQGTGSDEYLREGGTTGTPSGKSDFASQGQGATESEDIETGKPQDRDTDIEGGSESSEGNPS